MQCGTLHQRAANIALARASFISTGNSAEVDPFAAVDVLTRLGVEVAAKLVAGGKDVGKLVAVSPESTAAVADMKLDFALSGEVLDVRVEGSDVRAAPYVPPWWPEDESES